MDGRGAAVLQRTIEDRQFELSGYSTPQLLMMAMLNDLAPWEWTNPGKSVDITINAQRFCCIVSKAGLPIIDSACRAALIDVLAHFDVLGKSR